MRKTLSADDTARCAEPAKRPARSGPPWDGVWKSHRGPCLTPWEVNQAVKSHEKFEGSVIRTTPPVTMRRGSLGINAPVVVLHIGRVYRTPRKTTPRRRG